MSRFPCACPQLIGRPSVTETRGHLAGVHVSRWSKSVVEGLRLVKGYRR
jgi:hypothetical protein